MGALLSIHTSVLMDCTLFTRSEDRVRAGAAKLAKMLSAKQQGRLDGFFTVKPKDRAAAPTNGKGGSAGKRKGEEKGGAKKKGKK